MRKKILFKLQCFLIISGLVTSGPLSGQYDGKYCKGEGDIRFLRLIDESFAFFNPNPATPNVTMIYNPQWNTFCESGGWGAWWIQNSYGFSYSVTPFLKDPWFSILQNSWDLFWNSQGDGKRMGKPSVDGVPVTSDALLALVAPDGSLGDCANPEEIIYKQGDGDISIHDWFYEATAAGIVMEAEILLTNRDKKAISWYLPKMERACEFIEKTRDTTTDLFLAGPACNLLAPSYGGVKLPDGTFGNAYLSGLSVTYLAALNRMVELYKLTGDKEKLSLYEHRRDITNKSLGQLLAPAGYFVKSVEPGGISHGILGQGKFGYLEGVVNADAVALGIADDMTAEKIYRQIESFPEIRPFDFLLTNAPGLDDTYWSWGNTTGSGMEGIHEFGCWVNGGVWGTVEGRAILMYFRLGKFDDIYRSGIRAMKWAKDFRMDDHLTQRGENSYNLWYDGDKLLQNKGVVITVDNFAIPAATIRGLFGYEYMSDALVLRPRIPGSITQYIQKEPIRFGDKKIFLSCKNGGPNVKSFTVNGKPATFQYPDKVCLKYDELPAEAKVEIVTQGGWAKDEFNSEYPVTPALVQSNFDKGNLPDSLQKPYAVLMMMQKLLKRETGTGYEQAFVSSVLSSFEVYQYRQNMEAGPGYYRVIDKKRKEAIIKTYAIGALSLYKGFKKQMENYALKGDSRQKKVALLFANALSNYHTNHTWLPSGYPQKNRDDALNKSLGKFLSVLNGKIRTLVCWYSGSIPDSMLVFTNGQLNTGQTRWSCGTQFSTRSEMSGEVMDLNITFKLDQGIAQSAGVAVAFDFSDWSTDNYILVPSMIYGGNRFNILPVGYPPYIFNEKDKLPDMPVTVTNIPHLKPDGSHAKVELNTGNVATPMFSFFSSNEKHGFILLAEQGSRFGNNGLFIEEDAAANSVNKKMSFVISAPGVREQRYVMCGFSPSGDHGAEWKAGDDLKLRFKIYSFRADNITSFYEKVFDVRKALIDKNKYSCVTPFSAAADLILNHHDTNRWFENNKVAYYSNRPGDRNPYQFQLGWAGAPDCVLPMVIDENPERLRRTCLTLENKIFKAQGKTGLFYAIYRDGEFLGDPHGKMEEYRTISMPRRSMIVLYFCLRTFNLMKQRGHADLIKPEWEKSLKKCADGLIKVWHDYGQFGQYIDVETGEMDINGSTAGCLAGVSLVLAARYFNQPEYIKVAEAAVKMYYERDLLKGYAGGTSPDILQSPESQSAWEMMASSLALFEVTGKTEWLDRARFAANMFSTWMVSYDYHFPEKSAMQIAGTHAAGSVFASSQNNHSTPGTFEYEGDCLFRLFRATGDKRYMEMHKDQSHNNIQYVGTPYNPLRHESGYVTERVQLSDWEGGNMGSVDYPDSNMGWETQVAINCLINPGIYLHTDDDTFWVMDHVEAECISRDNKKLVISLTNPTMYDAKVSILAETSAKAKIPLPPYAFDAWPKVEVKAGKTRTISIDMDGQIKPV
jgi:hypothetical protein